MTMVAFALTKETEEAGGLSAVTVSDREGRSIHVLDEYQREDGLVVTDNQVVIDYLLGDTHFKQVALPEGAASTGTDPATTRRQELEALSAADVRQHADTLGVEYTNKPDTIDAILAAEQGTEGSGS